MEAHPGWRNDALLAFCRQAGVHVTAYAPLGRGAVMAAEGAVLAGKTPPGKPPPGKTPPMAARGGGTAASTAASTASLLDEALPSYHPSSLLEEAAVVEAAARLGCTPAQVLLLLLGPHSRLALTLTLTTGQCCCWALLRGT